LESERSNNIPYKRCPPYRDRIKKEKRQERERKFRSKGESPLRDNWKQRHTISEAREQDTLSLLSLNLNNKNIHPSSQEIIFSPNIEEDPILMTYAPEIELHYITPQNPFRVIPWTGKVIEVHRFELYSREKNLREVPSPEKPPSTCPTRDFGTVEYTRYNSPSEEEELNDSTGEDEWREKLRDQDYRPHKITKFFLRRKLRFKKRRIDQKIEIQKFEEENLEREEEEGPETEETEEETLYVEEVYTNEIVEILNPVVGQLKNRNRYAHNKDRKSRDQSRKTKNNKRDKNRKSTSTILLCNE